MRLLPVSLAVLLLAGCTLVPADDGGHAESGSFRAPDAIGEWTPTADWAAEIDKEIGGHRAADNEALQRAERDIDEERLSDSYGADAIVEAYQRNDMEQLVLLRMVATQAAGYFLPASDTDTERLGTEVPTNELRTIGDVECAVFHPLPQQKESDQNAYSECMMRSESLTVWLGPVAMVPDDLADLLQVAWDEIGGGAATPPAAVQVAPLELPATLGDFTARSTVDPDYPDYTSDDLAALGTAYGVDAGAGYYATPDLESGFELYLVDTEVVEPFVKFLDAERIGLLATNPERVEINGAICLVNNNTVPAGGDRDDLEPQVQWCYLTDGGRTAFARGVFGEAAADNALIPAILHTLL